MAHYDIFRHHLVLKYPAYGHALWEPSRGPSYPAVEVGDVGFIRRGRFHRLFNVLLPAEDPSHENYGVPEYHERLTLRMKEHIIPGTLSPNNLCSARVISEPTSRVLASGPDSPTEVLFFCRRKQGAVLSLPTEAKCEDTVALGDFGGWMIKHIDSWFAWVRQLGVGINRMEDIVLVTGTHHTRSWTNVAFPGGQADAQVTFGANVATRGDTVVVNWKFSHEYSRGAALNCGPNGEDLPEDQCIFIRGFRVTRKLIILPRELKAAAEPNPDPKSDDYDPPSESEGGSATAESISTSEEEGGTVFPASEFVSTSSDATLDARHSHDDLQLISIPTVPEYRDPLHTLLEFIAEEAPGCEMVLVHDDDLNLIDGLGDPSLETLQPETLLYHLRCHKPLVYGAQLGSDSSLTSGHAKTHKVALISTSFDFPLTTSDRSRWFYTNDPMSLRERSVSRPPRTFSLSHRVLSHSLSPSPRIQRPLLGFSQGLFSGSSSSKSSSFSATPPLIPSLGSTFEDVESGVMSDAFPEPYSSSQQLPKNRHTFDYTRTLGMFKSRAMPVRPGGATGSPYSQPDSVRPNRSNLAYDSLLRHTEESEPSSTSIVKPPRKIVGFDAPEVSYDDQSVSPGPWVNDGSLFSHENLAKGLDSLSLGRDDPGPVSSSVLPSSQLVEPQNDFTRFINSLRGASDTQSDLPQSQPGHPTENEPREGRVVLLGGNPSVRHPLYLVEFRAGRTDLFRAANLTLYIRVGDVVIVQADRGTDLGKVVDKVVTLTDLEKFQRERQSPSYVELSETPSISGQQPTSVGDTRSLNEIKPKLVYGIAGMQDMLLLRANKLGEAKALQACQDQVRQKKLPIEVVDAEYQWDLCKLTFYFRAEKQPDFHRDLRELVWELSRLYETRIVMAMLLVQAPDGIMKSDEVSSPSLTVSE